MTAIWRIGGTFPGQFGNRVGFAAAPGFSGLATATPFQTYIAGHAGWGGVLPSGSPGNPTVISFQDFDPGGAGFGTYVTVDGLPGHTAVHDIKFVGCRFQSNNVDNQNVEIGGSSNISFSYCSMTPRTALVTAPPFPAWPSASVGTGVNAAAGATRPPNFVTTYQIDFFNGYAFAVTVDGTGVTIDHCDIWGGADLVTILEVPGANFVMTDCWLHDCRFDNNYLLWNSATNYLIGQHTVEFVGTFQTYTALTNNTNKQPSLSPSDWSHTDNPDHSNAVGYLQGSGPAPTNILINHCTLASIGNTFGVSFQGSSGVYSFLTVTNNYISGWSAPLCMCVGPSSVFVAGSNNLTVMDNIIATDLSWSGPSATAGGSTPAWNNAVAGLNNIWRRNKLRVYPGDSWSASPYIAANDGQFLWPDGTMNTGDWTG